MESIPQTPYKKYGGYIMALLFVGFIATFVIPQVNWSEPEPEREQPSEWIELNDGTGVEYRQVDDIAVLYRNVLSDTHRVFAYVDELGFTGHVR